MPSRERKALNYRLWIHCLGDRRSSILLAGTSRSGACGCVACSPHFAQLPIYRPRIPGAGRRCTRAPIRLRSTSRIWRSDCRAPGVTCVGGVCGQHHAPPPFAADQDKRRLRWRSGVGFSLTIRPVPATWRRLAGATGSFAPIVTFTKPRRASGLRLAVSVVRSMASNDATLPMLAGSGRLSDINRENWPLLNPSGRNASSNRRASARAARCVWRHRQVSRTCRVVSKGGPARVDITQIR